jgi:hypothetical protein
MGSRGLVVALVAALGVGCGASDSQVGGDGGGSSSGSGSSGSGSGSSGGSGSGSGGSGSSSGTSSSGGSGGSSGSSGSSGSGSSSGSGGCTQVTNMTIGTNISMAVTWPGTTSAQAGSGTVHIWLLSDFTASGNSFSGTTRTCGTTLPGVTLTGLGSIAAGGSKVQILLGDSVWSASAMPTYMSTGTQTGYNPGDTITVNPTVALIGLALPQGTDPSSYAWPSSTWSFPSGTTFPDHDGDGNPGITATPQMGNGYVDPPTAVGLGGSAPSADQIYVATRSDIALSGKWSSCTDQSGTATINHFDNHVVGCHIKNGGACTTGAANTQADFIDQNRTVYAPGSATFVAKTLASGAKCSDVLTALP